MQIFPLFLSFLSESPNTHPEGINKTPGDQTPHKKAEHDYKSASITRYFVYIARYLEAFSVEKKFE